MCASGLHTLLNKIYQSIPLNDDDEGGVWICGAAAGYKGLNRPGEGEDWVLCIYRIDGG